MLLYIYFHRFGKRPTSTRVQLTLWNTVQGLSNSGEDLRSDCRVKAQKQRLLYMDSTLTVGAGVIPEWVVCLTSGGRDGSWLLLDTREGTITDFIQNERPEHDEPGPDSPDFWRAYHTLPIADFLEEWNEKYRSLKWVVVPKNELDAVMIRHDAATDVSPMTITPLHPPRL